MNRRNRSEGGRVWSKTGGRIGKHTNVLVPLEQDRPEVAIPLALLKKVMRESGGSGQKVISVSVQMPASKIVRLADEVPQSLSGPSQLA
jgi:hypothetical protein